MFFNISFQIVGHVADLSEWLSNISLHHFKHDLGEFKVNFYFAYVMGASYPKGLRCSTIPYFYHKRIL